MTRSKAFSEHQEERKRELLKKHGCYVLKDIKGDITVNNPENYSITDMNFNNMGLMEYSKRYNDANEQLKSDIEKIEDLNESIKEKNEKMFKLEADVVSCEFTIKNLEDIKKINDSQDSNYSELTKMKEKGNIFQKLLLRILGL